MIQQLKFITQKSGILSMKMVEKESKDLAEKIQFFEDKFNNDFQSIAPFYTQAWLIN